MIAAARHIFELDLPRPGGRKREHLESVARQTGRRPAALDGPPIPAWADHVFEYWQSLHQGRRSTDMGPAPIAWADLDAWSRVAGIVLRPVETRLIMQIEAAYFAERAKIEKAKP